MGLLTTVSETIISVGIDIGTTTTTMVVSQLTLQNTSGGFVVPRVEIVERKILYRSGLFFTPLAAGNRLDGGKIRTLVEGEYAKAGIEPGEVKSGAVIITGEAATRDNTREVLSSLAAYAGDFVVSTAGPDLEAIIAGRGSGAASYAQKHRRLVANVDVGGGSTNIALFQGNQVVATVATRVGGRMLELVPGTTKITRVSTAGKRVLAELGMAVSEGQTMSEQELHLLITTLVSLLAEVLSGEKLSPLGAELLIRAPLDRGYPIDAIVFSGGVAEAIYREKGSNWGQLTRYGDIGLLLGRGLAEGGFPNSCPVVEPVETSYATVIGAGMQLTELSGSTIYISDTQVLPLRDVPVVKPFSGIIPDSYEELVEGLTKSLEMIRTEDGRLQPLAVTLGLVGNPTFRLLKLLATAIVTAFAEYCQMGFPLILVLDADVGKALGYTIGNMLKKGTPIISIDQLEVENGDYIDIGEFLYSGTVVPVVIKTLAFPI